MYSFIKKHFAADSNTLRLLVLLLVSIIVLSVAEPAIFLTKDYVISMLYLFPEFGILALGMALCMISGGIDLCVVATANFSGILSALFLKAMLPASASPGHAVLIFGLAILLSLVVGLACGALSGLLITRLGIPPILATLGSSDLVMGAAIALTKGSSITNIPPILNAVGTHIIGGVLPVTLLMFILCVLLVSHQLSRTTFGYKLYMVGSNALAARTSGVNNEAVIMKAYMLSGLLAAISGLLMCARFNTARADFGSSYTMQAILICVLGGVNPNGGFGKAKGIVLAVLILQVLSSGFNMFPSISNFYRDLIWGAVLILIISINHIGDRAAAKKRFKTARKATDSLA